MLYRVVELSLALSFLFTYLLTYLVVKVVKVVKETDCMRYRYIWAGFIYFPL